MKKMKMAVSLMLAFLLACSTLLISASATIEGPELVGIEVDIEVGTYDVNDEWIPWDGEALIGGNVITVRVAPKTDFFTGASKIIVMYPTAYFQIQGANTAAYTVNTANTFYATSCTNYSGTTNQIPEGSWPAALKSVAKGGDGTFSSNRALSWTTQQNSTYPSHMPGTWLFSFDLLVMQDITPGCGAKVWMDSDWIKTLTNPGAMTFHKCLDDSKGTATGASTAYPFTMDLAGANVLLEPKFNITFDSAGGSPVETIRQYFSTPVAEPDEPTWGGYTFLGWLPNVPPTMPAEDTECVAQWEALPTSTISFDLNGGTSAAIAPITLYEGAPVTEPDEPEKDGYTFAGWLPDVPNLMPEEDTICVAKWLKDECTITFNSAGGTPVAPITQQEGSTVELPTPPTREGYAFDSWYPPCPTIMPEGDTLCVALWKANTYTITWDANGGTGGGTNSCDHDVVPTSIDAGTKVGYGFDGWTPAVVAATGNTTYTAKWKLNSYTITWDANGGTGGGANSCDHDVSPTAIDAGTKTGYTFDGWDPAVVAATGDAIYTAKWKANLVNITFDANGGTGGTGPTAMPYDSPLTAPVVKKEGFVLAGWTPVLPATVPATDTTYVAKWETTVVTVTMVGSEFEVNIQGWAAEYQYQIWSYQKVTSDILLGNDGNVQANQWILSKAYTLGSAGIPDSSNNGSINFMIPTFTSPTENYLIAVRIVDADGNFIQEIRDAYTPEAVQEAVITKVLVDGAVTTGYELREIKDGAQTLIKVIGNLTGMTYMLKTDLGSIDASSANLDEFLWDISEVAPGIYTVEITATNGDTEATQTITFELFTLAATTTYGSINEMILTPDALTKTVAINPDFANGTFSYRLREPGRSPIYRSVEYSTLDTIPAYGQTLPGIYHMFGYVTRAGFIGTENGGFDDGLIRTLVIPRDGSGTVTMTFTADPNQTSFAKQTAIVFTAEAQGLPGTVQYSFWRYDATGYVLVKDWSNDNTFNWTPARIGDYSLEARAKGTGAGSYEISRSLAVSITDTVEKKANITGITLNTADLSANAQPKKPIMIKANATSTNGDDILYKFYVYDADMRNAQLKGYSVDQHCVWTPREAGTYTISVLVKNQYSFGKYDAIESFEVVVD